MKLLGPVQRGLPLLSAVPASWYLYIIDIKDCFFSIPLHPKDRPRFAFTIPETNHRGPDSRYQWKVLPQGMANSPTICQLYVHRALQPLRIQYPQLYIIHYMDDVLMAFHDKEILQKAFRVLQDSFKEWNLQLAPDKIQFSDTGTFLGSKMFPQHITPQRVRLQLRNLRTLNDFQKLLGDINWLRPSLGIPSQEMAPLFKILEGDPALDSPRTLTEDARAALLKIEWAISRAQLKRLNYDLPWELCVFPTKGSPTAVLWQTGPLLWIHPHASPGKSIVSYPAAVADLALIGLQRSLEHFGSHPAKLIVPYTSQQRQILMAEHDSWAILVTVFVGEMDNHLPRHPLARFAALHPLIFPVVTAKSPIPGAVTIYTDGSKSGIGAYSIDGRVTRRNYGPRSPQMVECKIVLEVLNRFPEPLNLVSDSIYVVNALKVLETAGLIKDRSPVAQIFKEIQACLLRRSNPVFITHIRAHSSLPGPMAEGNALADAATRPLIFLATSEQQAKFFHERFHVTAGTLVHRFQITRQQAREIVTGCKQCVQFLPVKNVGVNPRGLRPLHMWQMDVTHIPSLGKAQFVHVSVDTCSGVIIATPLGGEKASHVIQHCLEAWSAWGKPRVVKTDNGPAYTSQKFQLFCAQMQVAHVTGIPYNPQGQAMVERAHRTLKSYLHKLQGGWEDAGSPRSILALASFVLNYLNLDKAGVSAAERHVTIPKAPPELAKWKDVLDNTWKGPDPILIRSRGAVCIFPQDAAQPFWVPERLIRSLASSPVDEPPPKGTGPKA